MSACIPLVIFDPQYRHNLDHLKYGNEGARQKGRAKYPQQGNEEIVAMGAQIERILMPSGYVMLWCDMYIHVTGASLKFFPNLTPVCDVIWDKGAIGMGYRTRRRCERAVFFQKPPIGARAAKLAVRWKTQPTIPDVWLEKITDKIHAHQKPQGLQQAVIEAITEPGQVVVDPVAGSFSVMAAAHACGRRFLGCDILGSAGRAPQTIGVRVMPTVDEMCAAIDEYMSQMIADGYIVDTGERVWSDRYQRWFPVYRRVKKIPNDYTCEVIFARSEARRRAMS